MARRNVPPSIQIPSNVDPQLRATLQTIKESLEITVGQRGDPLDAAPTRRELIDAGFSADVEQTIRTGSFQPRRRISDAMGEDWKGAIPAPDNVTLTATASKLFVGIDTNPDAADAIFHTQVFGIESGYQEVVADPDVANAELIATVPIWQTNVFLPTNPERQWVIWVRHVGHNGQYGPYYNSDGDTVASASRVADLVAEINGNLDKNAFTTNYGDILQKSIDGVDLLMGELADPNGDVTAIAGFHLDKGGNVAGLRISNSATGGSEIRMVADSYKLYAPGTNYDPDDSELANELDLVLGYDSMRDTVVMRKVAVEELTVDSVTANNAINGADHVTVVEKLKADVVEGVHLKGGRLMLGLGGNFGPNNPVAGQGYNTYLDENGNAYFGNSFRVQSSTTGARLDIQEDRISVYNANGEIVLRLGRL